MTRVAVTRRAKAVLLDVDGTLYRQGPLRRRMAIELATFAAARPVKGFRTVRILRAFRRLREELRGTLPAGGSCESLQYESPARLLRVPTQEVRQAVAAWMHERPLRHLRRCMRPGLVPFLEACRRRGVLVGALSDYPTHGKLAALGVLPFFDLELCSTDPMINAFKPSPAGILAACRAWGIAPDELLAVGDRDEIDGEAARAAGAAFALVGTTAGDRGVWDFVDLMDNAGLGWMG